MRGAVGPVLAACLAATPAVACDAPPWSGRAMDGSLAVNPAPAPGPAAAWFEDPTTRYAHAVLGDGVEAGTLAVLLSDDPSCAVARVTLPEAEVFEDLAPRLADLDGDGRSEILVVQSHRDLGARLAVYAITPDGPGLRLLTATPNIGQRNRWLAPVAAADLDGDGAIEIAYVDRPHLARTLRVWRYLPAQGALVEVAALPGLTNHRIGEGFITGGLRDCGTGPELVLADADWSRLMGVSLGAGGLTARALAPFSAAAVVAALACRD
ncbi:FG-GAP repeat domain-containing protein [Roseicyclus marinus]|uniref:FG-GAP repeat domain-containing protein n=1 Tax=Roseicyclus marinus TaxID=2161673 RepID=UPI00240FF8AC|nr:VCBS repeat-containing protein [Roseicyclus marinus]MDG3040668.1 VCBS repeat-containing protein [Roseicyclus marinus]